MVKKKEFAFEPISDLQQKHIEAHQDALLDFQGAERLAQEGKKHRLFVAEGMSVGDIVKRQIFTRFNLLNFTLALIVLLVSFIHPKFLLNLGFMLVVVFNTGVSIFQELQAKKTLEKIRRQHQNYAHILRKNEDGQIMLAHLPEEDIVLGDVLYLEAGQALAVDGTLLFAEDLSLDESALTGESDAVPKEAGESILSGTFVLSGLAYVKVSAVGEACFAQKITKTASEQGRVKSQIRAALEQLVKVLGFALIPVGILLFVSSLLKDMSVLQQSDRLALTVLSVVAALVGMIPEGLVLLTSIAFAMSVTRLALQHKTLIQSLPAVESLARVDVLCLDKTGTLTTGKMRVLRSIDQEEFQMDASMTARLLLHAEQHSENMTQKALTAFWKARFSEDMGANERLLEAKQQWKVLSKERFSSEKKYATTTFEKEGEVETLYLGAPDFLLTASQLEFYQKMYAQDLAEGHRVLVLAKTTASTQEEKKVLTFFVVEDILRPNALETLNYFTDEKVKTYILSGDHTQTVFALAKRVGLKLEASEVEDMSFYPSYEEELKSEAMQERFKKLVQSKRIFGRVSPLQKKYLVQALQSLGHTVAMTGDGINDVPALKSSDCALALAEGTEMARAVADVVLLSNDLDSLIPVLHEGRRVINNLERVSSLFLTKTFYSSFLAFSFIFLPYRFPFLPIQLTLISNLTIGLPAFVLALSPNKERVEGNFYEKMIERAVPYGLGISLSILLHHFFTSFVNRSLFPMFNIDFVQEWSVILTACGAFALLYTLSKPFNPLRKALFVTSVSCFLFALFFLPKVFLFTSFILLKRQILLAFSGELVQILRVLYLIGSMLFVPFLCSVLTPWFKNRKKRKAQKQLKQGRI